MYLPYLPDKPGGTRVGSSYLKAYIQCPRQWFYRYAWPHLDEEGRLVGTGLVREDSYRDAPLEAGAMFHQGMEEYLRSGCRDGEDTGQYDLERALGSLDALKPPDSEHQRERWERSRQEARSLLQAIDHRLGPDGLAPGWPATKVVCDQDGQPLIERSFTVPLGYRDYIYTCQADAIILRHDMDLQVWEHKTSAPGMWVGNRLQNISTDSQITGEIYALQHHFPDSGSGWERLDGARVSVYIKGWKPSSRYPEPVVSEDARRTPHMLEQFRQRTVSLLQDIDYRMGVYEERVGAGAPADEVVASLFPNWGMLGDACFAYRRECAYMDLCKIGHTPGVLRSYRQRATIAPDESLVAGEQRETEE